MMNTRFADLTKVPNQPAMRLLAMANAKLDTKLTSPANATVEVVLAELEQADAPMDMLRLMSVALPARERVWWACLAARDVTGPDPEVVPPPLAASEAWVRKPSDATRDTARLAVEVADIDDDTVLCASAVVYCDETLGTGELAQYPAPPGASQTSAFGMNIVAMGTGSDVMEMAHHLVDRAVDIARGGNGQIPLLQNDQAAIEGTAP
ncbi:DUF6931 family protein [Pseudosulfitobacter sp. SM2401]|jgi:hypothetical protein|uniref:DUF6931 family protein n=1 Tax=Pseudosulfitobacter sp. SM2401 TaxID=3350098 RepID=UPI0036F2214A